MSHKIVPALLLDLDGTVRESKSGETFIKGPDDIVLKKGMEKTIWLYRNMGWLVVGISNQGGVAFGHKTLAVVEAEIAATTLLFKQNPFHLINICPYMEGGTVAPYNVRSLRRKPDIGMLALAEFEAYKNGYVIDWDKSLFVGDREEDEQCARNARVVYKHVDVFLNTPHEFTVGGDVDFNFNIAEAVQSDTRGAGAYVKIQNPESMMQNIKEDKHAYCYRTDRWYNVEKVSSDTIYLRPVKTDEFMDFLAGEKMLFSHARTVKTN